MSFRASPACNPCPEDLECSEIIYVEVNILMTIGLRGGLRRKEAAVVGQDCAEHSSWGWREGGRKHEWVVGAQLSITCNSKTTEEAVAVHIMDVQRGECPSKEKKSKPGRPSKSRLISSLYVLESAVNMRFLQLQR